MMKRTLLLAAALSVALQTVPAAAAVDCDAPRNFVDVKACDAARQGLDTLRRFVWRTRMIYALYLPDYLHAVRP
jgi:hypothetical protein